MRKRIMLLFVYVLTIHLVFSQSSNTSKQINDVKRDGQYFYAESTLETEKSAHESATLMLANFINDYINSNHLPSDKKISEKDLATAKSLVMKRGTMVRVFLYVKKGDFVPVDIVNSSSAKEGEVVKHEEATKKEVAENTVKQQADKKESSNKTAEIERVVLEQTLPVESKTPEAKSADPPLVNAAGPDNSLRLSVEWQQAVVDNILKESSLKGVMALLNRYKAEYKVKRFGTYNECGNAALNFWIICESDSSMSLITILGPGTDTRVNFKTLQHDSLGNYSGKNAIWFELVK